MLIETRVINCPYGLWKQIEQVDDKRNKFVLEQLTGSIELAAMFDSADHQFRLLMRHEERHSKWQCDFLL